MLSKGAWNALLKTLEEPPAHVIFILATTEAQKIPDTVMSRCQTFSFKKPTQKILKDVVVNIAKKEGFSLEQSSADLIALLGDGSFRDAQSVLQKVISASKDKKISVGEVILVTGAPKSEMINNFIKAIDESNIELGLSAVKDAETANIDMLLYFKMILYKMRLILLLKNTKNLDENIKEEMTDNDFTFLKGIADKADTKINSKVLYDLLGYYDMVNKSYIPNLPLELALVRIIGKEI